LALKNRKIIPRVRVKSSKWYTNMPNYTIRGNIREFGHCKGRLEEKKVENKSNLVNFVGGKQLLIYDLTKYLCSNLCY
jgi:hypothetical protein